MGKVAVIHFSDCFFPRINGVSIAINTISNALKEHQVYNIIVSPSYESNSDVKFEDFYGIDLIKVPSKTFVFNKEDRFMLFSYNQKLFNVIKSRVKNYSVVVFLFHNIMNSYFIGYNVMKLLQADEFKGKILKIYYYHTFWEHYLHYLPLPKFISGNFLKILEKQILRKMDYIMVANEHVKNVVNKKMGSEVRIVVNPLPINQVFFNGKSSNLTNPPNEKYFVYVGRIGKEKNLYFLLDVFKELLAFDNDFYLYLIGDGPEKQNLISYSKCNGTFGRTLFLGYMPQDDIIGLYKYSQGVIFTSKTETLGLVILEAMSSGGIVFTLDVPPFNSIINNLNDGVLVDYENSRYFAKKVFEIISDKDLSERIRKNAINRSQNFHPSTFVHNFLSVIG
ncbi:MAG: glycosyltransferase [Candidatus Calescibacterium sp.]|nr:glycosyltransferase [Candidatus Calescibacterium sp.]MDW8132100.1 glycosyltransferase [Candidatus Calescibacterium sp.]